MSRIASIYNDLSTLTSFPGPRTIAVPLSMSESLPWAWSPSWGLADVTWSLVKMLVMMKMIHLIRIVVTRKTRDSGQGDTWPG